MVDNFNEWLNVCKDDFKDNNIHFLKITQREKDLTDMNDFIPTLTKNTPTGRGNHIIYSCYFRNCEDVMKHKETIIKICQKLNARAYMSIAPINYNKTLTNIIHQLLNTFQEPNVYQFNDIINNCFTETEKTSQRIMLDVDVPMLCCYRTLKKTLINCGVTIIAEFPSKTGFSLIINEFDVSKIYANLDEYLVMDELDVENGLTKEFMLENVHNIHIMYNSFINLYIPDFDKESNN